MRLLPALMSRTVFLGSKSHRRPTTTSTTAIGLNSNSLPKTASLNKRTEAVGFSEDLQHVQSSDSNN